MVSERKQKRVAYRQQVVRRLPAGTSVRGGTVLHPVPVHADGHLCGQPHGIPVFLHGYGRLAAGIGAGRDDALRRAHSPDAAAGVRRHCRRSVLARRDGVCAGYVPQHRAEIPAGGRRRRGYAPVAVYTGYRPVGCRRCCRRARCAEHGAEELDTDGCRYRVGSRAGHAGRGQCVDFRQGVCTGQCAAGTSPPQARYPKRRLPG